MSIASCRPRAASALWQNRLAKRTFRVHPTLTLHSAWAPSILEASIMHRLFGVGLVVLVLQSAAAGQVAAKPVKWADNGHLYEPVAAPGGVDWVDAQLLTEARG